MNKQSTRAFAAGLFLSGITLLLFSLYDQSTDDPKALLEDKGYVILTETEAKQQREELSSLQKQVEELTQKKTEALKEDDETVDDAHREMSLTVSPGMTPKEIADKLENSNIIRNASDLNSYLIKSGLAEKIQIGEYQLSSEMTLEEISQILTN